MARIVILEESLMEAPPLKLIFWVAVAQLLAACSPSDSVERMRERYVAACSNSAAHLERTSQGRVTADEACPCMFDHTLEKVDKKYIRFASKLMVISAGNYGLSHQGFGAYMSRLKELLASRHDGNAAYAHTLKAMEAAKSMCMETR